MKCSPARWKAVCRYSEKSQKAKLLQRVQLLAEALERPVSSEDLHEYLKENPDERPELSKTLAQQLISAAREIHPDLAHLYPMGLWRNKAYYAPDLDPIWEKRWRGYLAKEKLKIELRRPFVESVFYLQSGIYQSFASNAARGWILEMNAQIIPYLEGELKLLQLQEKIQELETIASPDYIPKLPEDLISRKEASELLTLESYRRRDRSISLNRWLVFLSWPTVSHFKREDPVRYSRKMIDCFMSYKWPLANEDPIFAQALFETLRFGIHRFPETTPINRSKTETKDISSMKTFSTPFQSH